MDKIIIKDLLVRGIIGLNPDERVNEQDILINIVMFTDIRQAAETENVKHLVSYSHVAKRIACHVKQSSDYLVEKLVTDIAHIILSEYDVERVRVRVEKPEAVSITRSVGVEIERTLEDFDD